MNNFDIIRNDGRLLYEYIRGSHLYNLNNEDSDIDTGGVYSCTKDEFYGCYGYKPQVSDDKHDNNWFEIGELVRLLLKSNPTVLEALFVPENKIIGNVSPLMQTLIDNRERFISKECFNPFFGYAKSQIEKCRGLNKKIVNPITERLTPYDFIYTFNGQGSIPFKNWLMNHGLYQEYCGLVNIPNMHNTYGVYYDFGMHADKYEKCLYDSEFMNLLFDSNGSIKAKGYRGIIGDDSNELRLSSIANKNEKPICYIFYNKSGYESHCKQYLEYQEWVKHRNPVRYKSNLDKNYDSKNVMHSFRLMHMGMEIAEGKGIILERTDDRQFLMDVRNHKFEYDEIIKMLEDDRDRMNSLMEKSTIQDKVDQKFVNDLMIKIRNEQFN